MFVGLSLVRDKLCFLLWFGLLKRGYSDIGYFYIYCFGTPLKSSSSLRVQKSVVRIC